MTQPKAGGILAAWNDCAPEGLAEYERWYAHHLAERVGVPGFREGRRYEAVAGGGGDRQFFTFYPVDTVEVLSSAVYLARLENPHPDTVAAMRHFRRMMRTVCVNAQEDGEIAGAYAVTLRFVPEDAALTQKLAPDFASSLRTELDALHVRLWVAAPGQTGQTVEARARGGVDERMGFAVIVEASRAAEAEAIRQRLADVGVRARHQLPGGGMLGVYALLCALHADDL
jgi:hypothetical protein